MTTNGDMKAINDGLTDTITIILQCILL